MALNELAELNKEEKRLLFMKHQLEKSILKLEKRRNGLLEKEKSVQDKTFTFFVPTKIPLGKMYDERIQALLNGKKWLEELFSPLLLKKEIDKDFCQKFQTFPELEDKNKTPYDAYISPDQYNEAYIFIKNWIPSDPFVNDRILTLKGFLLSGAATADTYQAYSRYMKITRKETLSKNPFTD